MSRPPLVRIWVVVLAASFFVAGVCGTPASASTPRLRDDVLAVSLSPSTGVTTATPVTVTVNSPGSWAVNLCDAAIGPSPDLLGLINNCLPVGVIAGPSGPITFDQTTFQTIGGQRAVDCAASPTSCVVVVYPGDQFVPMGPYTSTPISFVVEPLAAQPSASLTDGQTIQVFVNGTPSSTQQVAQCVLPTGATLATSGCGTPTSVPIPASGTAQLSFAVAATLPTASGDVNCTTGTCGLASFDSTGTVIASIALGINPTPHFSLSPSTGLLDGDALTLSATGLVPGENAIPEQCIGPPSAMDCIPDYAHQQTAAADGTVTTTVLAAQRFSQTSYSFGYCRLSDCSYGFQLSALGPQPDPIPYTLEAGAVTATPSIGLTDGQDVTLAGTGLMPTYAGRAIGPFGSGGWAVAECSAAIGTAPTLLQAFQDCGFPGGGGGATITGSTLSTTIQPHATLTAILGATTNCTTSPGACVVGLVRFEQDGSMSTHLTPLTFG